MSKDKSIFERFSSPFDFLEKDPDLWIHRNDFNYGLNIARQLKIINDTSDRGVKLIQDYNKILAKNEEEMQFILKIISENRKRCPRVTSTLCQQICNYNNNLHFGLIRAAYPSDACPLIVYN